jgi:hypothetical protein
VTQGARGGRKAAGLTGMGTPRQTDIADAVSVLRALQVRLRRHRFPP